MVQVVIKQLLIFVRKFDQMKAKIGCTSSTSLIELIEMNLKLEEKLEKSEDAFERDESWTCK